MKKKKLIVLLVVISIVLLAVIMLDVKNMHQNESIEKEEIAVDTAKTIENSEVKETSIKAKGRVDDEKSTQIQLRVRKSDERYKASMDSVLRNIPSAGVHPPGKRPARLH